MGHYRASFGEEWNCPMVPHGGLVTATSARAMNAELDDPTQRLRTLTTVYAAQVQSGAVDIDVSLLRKGRSMSQLSATVRNPGAAAGHATVAVFGAQRNGFEFTDAIPPADIPEPDDCPSFRDPLPEGVEERDFPFPFWEQVEGRPALGHPPWEDYVPDRALRATWYRFDEPARLDDGRWDPLALVTMCDMMPGAVGEKVGPGEDDWYAPSADLTVHLLNDARSEWVLAVNRARYAGDGYASADQELWDMHGSEPVLAAYGTQVMFFTVLPPRD
jgi:acyl-CoA thioesterase